MDSTRLQFVPARRPPATADEEVVRPREDEYSSGESVVAASIKAAISAPFCGAL
jgi:hypothetical protein